jgi:hypothetical protein
VPVFFADFSAVLLIFPFAFFMPTPILHRTVGVTPNPGFGRVASGNLLTSGGLACRFQAASA